MLSEILKKEDCAACRFCCSFRRQSLWETPIFTLENTESIEADQKLDASVLQKFSFENNTYARYDLSNNYKTDDSEEEAPCPYLSTNGCILDANEKPWDCKIWPLRVMRKTDGALVIALTPTCPSVNKIDIEKVREFVNEKLADSLFEYVNDHSFLIKQYHEGFPILVEKNK